MQIHYERYLLTGLALTIVLIVGLAITWQIEPARMAQAADELETASILNGRQLYVDNCTACHGTRGEGIVGPALNNRLLLEEASDDVLFASIRAGRPGTTMPAWGQENGGSLTDEDIRHLVTFIRAWEETAPDVNVDEFVANPSRGAEIYAGSCFICHGEDGSGGTAPSLNDPARLNALNDDWYRQTITNGRPAKGMPTWGTVLSPNQIEDLIALIGAWRAGEEVLPEVTVAELLDSALFTLSQGDSEDALFYLNRAKPIAFGPALEEFDPIISLIEDEELNDAMDALGNLRMNWPVGDAAVGAEVYADACDGCHGSQGQGGVGRQLKPSTFVADSTNAEMLAFLQTGRAGTAMRSFEGQLSESQLADVIAFLRTWQDD